MASSDLTLAFDADDTLWHNEVIFEKVHERYRELLAQYHNAKTVDERLFAAEMRNLELYGYGVKGFTLSAIETAIELSSGRISAEEISRIIAHGREMLAHPVELLDGVEETLRALAPGQTMMVITKGDLRDQERKLAKSGLSSFFQHVEIVSEKNEASYAAIFRRHGVEPQRFVMIGNSLKSDILPVLALGGRAVYVPYHLTWAAERVERLPDAGPNFAALTSLRDLPAWLAAR